MSNTLYRLQSCVNGLAVLRSGTTQQYNRSVRVRTSMRIDHQGCSACLDRGKRILLRRTATTYVLTAYCVFIIQHNTAVFYGYKYKYCMSLCIDPQPPRTIITYIQL